MTAATDRVRTNGRILVCRQSQSCVRPLPFIASLPDRNRFSLLADRTNSSGRNYIRHNSLPPCDQPSTARSALPLREVLAASDAASVTVDPLSSFLECARTGASGGALTTGSRASADSSAASGLKFRVQAVTKVARTFGVSRSRPKLVASFAT